MSVCGRVTQRTCSASWSKNSASISLVSVLTDSAVLGSQLTVELRDRGIAVCLVELFGKACATTAASSLVGSTPMSGACDVRPSDIVVPWMTSRPGRGSSRTGTTPRLLLSPT